MSESTFIYSSAHMTIPGWMAMPSMNRELERCRFLRSISRFVFLVPPARRFVDHRNSTAYGEKEKGCDRDYGEPYIEYGE